jgi:predicted amidohydrolase YtcJ
MTNLRLALLCLVVSCAGNTAPSAQPEPSGPALLVSTARIWGHPEADAVLVRGDRIAAVGRAAEIGAPGATTLDARNGWVLPGFHDAHIHAMSGGMKFVQLDLSPYQTLDAAVDAVKKWADAHPELPWILGRGWQYGIVPKGKFPTRAELDKAAGGRPVYLRAYDGHTAWCSTKALELAGITKDTKDPADGTIAREKNGAPAGALLEGAMSFVAAVAPQPSRPEQLAALERATAELVSLGITSIDDIDDDPMVFELYDELERAGKLPLRVTVSMPLEGDLAKFAELRAKYDRPMLRFGFLKGFLDGVVESKTAYMIDAYAGAKDRGTPLIPPDELYELVTNAHKAGFSVALHAIGDAAVRLSLDTYERVHNEVKDPALVDRIEHIEVLNVADAPRFAKLGVIASMQPYHSNPFGDTPDDGVWSTNLGATRLPNTFPWKTLADAGATLAFGSDWPVMTADPLAGLGIALTRRDEEGKPAAGWNAHQAVDAATAIRAYSEGAAAAIGRSSDLGKLAPGMLADVVVLAPHVEPAQAKTLYTGERIAAVIVGGVVRWQPASAGAATAQNGR